MALPSKTNQIVSLSDASKLTGNFRKSAGEAAIKGQSFWNETLQKLLEQKGCVAVRFYYAQKDDGTQTFVAVGVDQDGNDLTGGILGEENFPCPPWCSAPNQLNS